MKRDADHQWKALRIAICKVSATVAHFDTHPMSANGCAKDVTCATPHLIEALCLFEGVRVTFTAERYVRRIMKYGECSPCNVVIALLYLQRIQQDSCAFVHLSSTNMQRLLLIAIMVASKIHDDIHFPNKFWGTIGEIDRSEIKSLEAM